ncbi:hypothetical protein GCM10010329_58770 [Streptomyces spiroverticillatus]|uniref:DUF2470 domain-containing protein n=1 Tax=Streptomyces finlayi TaxID=67296 RepID=A0A919CD56_9ACTN|nr:DUF2470 domain-containing protein [Streptomyces finlayi]GHA27729.1 hypothetical protein GCM10010329_58770 [Streptomyces spiroverticillatus]GHD08773.1 hypothetical protein GCM10010334_62430 [Streptomyces finlayi]
MRLPRPSRAQQPTSAERVRSVLAAAHSMTVVSDGVHTEVRRLDGEGVMSRIHVHEPTDQAHPSPGHERIPVRLEFTDVAPTPVRDRVRARVTVTGLLAAPYDSSEAPQGSTCMEFGQAVIEDADGRAYVTLEELEHTLPDPLAVCEAGMLTHLLDAHAELVPLLLRLVRAPRTADLTRAMPVAMDRYGLTLRLEYPRAHADVRLAFPTPVTGVEQAGPQIQGLLRAARRMSHPNRLPA